MTRELITDLDDPRIAVYRALKATNLTRGLDQFVVEGEKLVERLLASRFPVVSILATDRYVCPDRGASPGGCAGLCGQPSSRFTRSSASRFTAESWPARSGLPGLRRKRSSEQGDGRCTLVVCPRLSNPENLGAIARIGDVFGIDAILAGPSCPDPLSRRVLRVSMGSALRLACDRGRPAR